MSITLYGDGFQISPFVFSVFVALEEKRLPFRYEPVKLDQKQSRTPEFRQRSPFAKVPALDHDGFQLGESLAIVEYLEDAFPEPRVLPVDLRERARTRMVLSWLRSDLHPLREDRPTWTMFYDRGRPALTAAGEQAAARLLEMAQQLIPDGRTTLAAEWSIADADLAFMLQRLGLNGHVLPGKLRTYVDATWSRTSVRKWVERERAPYVEY
jgi:glutathione S-transferase